MYEGIERGFAEDGLVVRSLGLQTLVDDLWAVHALI